MEQHEKDFQQRVAQLAASCACNNLRRAARAVTNYYDSLIKQRSGLRSTQVTMLVVCYLGGEQTIGEVADRLGVDRTTLTRNLKPLEAEGLIAVAAGSDQRTRVVSLTSKGERALHAVLPLWEQAQAHMVEGIGVERFGPWLAQLGEVTSIAEQA
jgi:DNA-binding MarR family transcriptional regulator